LPAKRSQPAASRPSTLKQPGIHFSEAAGLRHLHVGGTAIQSAMRVDAPDELALAYTRAMMAALLFQPAPRDVIMVGVGGGSMAKWVYRHLPRTRTVAIEVDFRVVSAAHRMFHLPLGRKRLRVLVGDGADYVDGHPDSADLILLDAFVNHRQAPSVRTAEFYRAARRALRRDGVLAINFMSDDPGLRAYLRRLAAAFDGRLACLRAIGEDNVIVFAFADDPGVITPASLVGRAIDLQRRYGLEFRSFAQNLRPLHRVRVDRRPLLAKRELDACRQRPEPARGAPARCRSG
jgi:spermidine synthase